MAGYGERAPRSRWALAHAERHLKEAEVLAQRARHAVCEFLVKFGLTPRKR